MCFRIHATTGVCQQVGAQHWACASEWAHKLVNKPAPQVCNSIFMKLYIYVRLVSSFYFSTKAINLGKPKLKTQQPIIQYYRTRKKRG